jgi:hypothetical protein
MRLKIIAAMLTLYQDNPITVDLWNSLNTHTRSLGMDGMSDDEEDGDGTKPYKVSIHPWRNPDIADWMDFIDARYHLIQPNMGNTMRRRIRGGGSVLRRQFVPNLDPWLYNSEYPITSMTVKTLSQGLPRVGLSNIDGLAK